MCMQMVCVCVCVSNLPPPPQSGVPLSRAPQTYVHCQGPVE